MQTIATLVGSDKNDPQVVKRWAAEDFAIAIGLLRECPYHGEPFKTRRKGITQKALAAGLVDPQDPIVKVFNGDTRELLQTLERVTGDYAEHCTLCAASDHDDLE
jgi:hypothetical protein